MLEHPTRPPDHAAAGITPRSAPFASAAPDVSSHLTSSGNVLDFRGALNALHICNTRLDW